jgi:hypothetical protein
MLAGAICFRPLVQDNSEMAKLKGKTIKAAKKAHGAF